MSDAFAPFSLLFADPKSPREEFFPLRTLDFIGELSREDNKTLHRILSWKTSRRDLEFRREILEDFLQSPTLLTKAEAILRRRDLLAETARREGTPAPDQPWKEGLEILKDNALSALEHLKFLHSSHEEMAGQAPESGGMFAFAEYLRRRATSPQVKALTEQLAALPLLRAESAETVLRLNLDRYGAVQSADLAYLGGEAARYLKKNPPRREDFTAEVPKDGAEALVSGAIYRLSVALQAMTAAIRDAFEPLREGLVFYHFALSVTEWGRSKGYGWRFPTPVHERGPKGRGIRNPLEGEDGIYRPPFTCTARPLEAYRGEWGTEALRNVARIQVLAAAGLPVVAEELMFCPEERVLVCDFEGKTVEEEIEGLAALYRQTRRGDILLLNRPLMTVGASPAAEVLGNLLRAFHKKGAAVRLATDLSVD